MPEIVNKSDHRVFGFSVAALTVLLYIVLAYHLKRQETGWLIAILATLFACYGYLISYSKFSIRELLTLAVVLRLIFLFADPELSDDYWRFIWDGSLLSHGLNPYANTPDEVINRYGFSDLKSIYPRLNNCCTHSTYTPMVQWIFFGSVWLGKWWGGPVFWMRLVVFLAEFVSAFLMIKVLKESGLKVRSAFWYLLNPLIILEFTGNLHHEVFVVFFLCLVFFFMMSDKSNAAAMALGGAVAAKLLPMIFLPGFLKRKGWNSALLFSVLVLSIPLLTFLPWLTIDSVAGFFSGLRLYFDRLEFNPSLWFVIRALGYGINGFNIIQWAVPVMAVCSSGIILWYSMIRPGAPGHQTVVMARQFEIVLLVYLLFSAIVHPWYVAPMVLFAVFSGSRFGVLWSGLVMLTYAGYSKTGYQEYPMILLVEYLSVGLFFVMERKKLWASRG